MNMTIETTEQDKASVKIPHAIMVRFLRSLGAEIADDVRLHVFQPSYGGDKGDVNISWELEERKTQKTVELVDDDDIEIYVALAEMK